MEIENKSENTTRKIQIVNTLWKIHVESSDRKIKFGEYESDKKTGMQMKKI